MTALSHEPSPQDNDSNLPPPPLSPQDLAQRTSLSLSAIAPATSTIGYPPAMTTYLLSKGLQDLNLLKLQFNTERLIAQADMKGKKIFFSLRGRRVENSICLQVVESGSASGIPKGHIFYDIDESGRLISGTNNDTAPISIISLSIETSIE